jgi:hypothetical protein
VNRKEIEESTGLYMDAGTGTKKELYRQALSAGEEGSLRGGATRLDRRCLFPDEPNTNHFREAPART